MKRRGKLLIFGEYLGEWNAPDPRGGNSSFQAMAYRHLVLSHDGIEKLRAIRRGLREEAKGKQP